MAKHVELASGLAQGEGGPPDERLSAAGERLSGRLVAWHFFGLALEDQSGTKPRAEFLAEA
jgi:hypothetical protein